MFAVAIMMVGIAVVALSGYSGNVTFPSIEGVIVDVFSWYVVGAYLGVFPAL